MAEKNRKISVTVTGIRYEEFAQIKWRQFLRLFSAGLMLVLALVLSLVLTGKISGNLPVPGILAIALIVLALLAVFRSGIRKEYKAAKLAELQVTYVFDRDGWGVRQGNSRANILWKNTWRVQRGDKSLLIYPNKKSVNLIPLRYLTAEELSTIIGWCTGK